MRLPPWLYNLIYKIRNINFKDKKTLAILIGFIASVIGVVIAIVAIVASVSAVQRAEEEGRWIAGISVSKTPDNTIFNIGDEADFSGIVLQVIQNNGDFYLLEDMSEVTFSGFNSEKAKAGQVITVTYKSHTATFKVDIEEKEKPIPMLSEIRFLSSPTFNNTYSKSADTSLDMTGAKIELIYSNGDVITMDALLRDVVESWDEIMMLDVNTESNPFHLLTIEYTDESSGITKTTTFEITLTE